MPACDANLAKTTQPADSTIESLPNGCRGGGKELPEGFRVVFELREFMAMDYESIAKELEVSVGTVRSRLHRSRRLVREFLKSNN